MRFLGRLFRQDESDAPASMEPLDHPELRRMSLRELADLPLQRPAQLTEAEFLRPPGRAL